MIPGLREVEWESESIGGGTTVGGCDLCPTSYWQTGLHKQCLESPYTTQQRKIRDRHGWTGSIQSQWSVVTPHFYQLTHTYFFLDHKASDFVLARLQHNGQTLTLTLQLMSMLFTSWLNRVGLAFHSYCMFSPDFYSWGRLIKQKYKCSFVSSVWSYLRVGEKKMDTNSLKSNQRN